MLTLYSLSYIKLSLGNDSNCSLQLYLRSELVHASVTRENYYKLVSQHCRYDLRKYYFTKRVVPVWNSLPNEVVMADNINIFKNRLDKFWASYDFCLKSYIISVRAYLHFCILNF